VNYYERHLGDYAKDAGHLSLLEHGAYTLLLDRYYSTEAPIPETDVFRVCRASTRPERDAVVAVLREFFLLIDGAWHHKRCEEELERFRSKREKARRSAEARWQGQRQASEGNANASPNAMRSHSEGNALQSPDSRLQEKNYTPGLSERTTTTSTRGDPEPRATEPPQAAPVTYLTPAGQACRLMREAGCIGVNPSHPHLLAALTEGVSPQQLADLVRELPGKAFPYLVQTARARLAEAKTTPTTGAPRARSPSLQERLDAITTERL
jgi:uncharacterized protein YdaU (DUF1376 family)